MPTCGDWRQDLIEKIGPLKCEVEPPAEWTDFFDQAGRLASGPKENRRFPRSYLRTSGALEYRQSLPALKRQSVWHEVYTKDVSRCGLSFLHSEQLFPSEQMRLILPDGQSRIIQVVRCRRIQHHCFEIGVKFISALCTTDPLAGDRA